MPERLPVAESGTLVVLDRRLDPPWGPDLRAPVRRPDGSRFGAAARKGWVRRAGDAEVEVLVPAAVADVAAGSLVALAPTEPGGR